MEITVKDKFITRMTDDTDRLQAISKKDSKIIHFETHHKG